MIGKLFIAVTLLLLLIPEIRAQSSNKGNQSGIVLSERILPAPEAVFKMFQNAGMNPVPHELTDLEIQKVEKAFALLPPLHRKILQEHLYSISFMDNMPNTALTSPIETADSTKKFNITFRAETLHETISEWATWKENTYYIQPEDSAYRIKVDGGKLDAIVYILLHEATHVVDAVLNITPHPDDKDVVVEPTPFTSGIWYKMNVPNKEFIIPSLEKTRFRSGKSVSVCHVSAVYSSLQQTPFVSLYSMAS
ncbi:hypothetical protein [Olivibacter sp. XZL3]|uniref:hypothetical protein n=1 Tax=Olivibacter sp. XZL3 TaxID=1735116 RepID=UPI0019809C26|nr:hypothetical protein [Olivibacter sp. XZL3]